LPLVGVLVGCMQAEGPQEPPAFVGRWACETAVLTLTPDSYDEGQGPQPLRLITREDRSYTLFLQDGRRFGLGLVTDTALTWVREGSRDGQTCRRVN
jgi:hypothetical protein